MEPTLGDSTPTNRELRLSCATVSANVKLSWHIQFRGEAPLDTRLDGTIESLQARGIVLEPNSTARRLELRISYVGDAIFGNNGTRVTCLATVDGLPMSRVVPSVTAEVLYHGTLQL